MNADAVATRLQGNRAFLTKRFGDAQSGFGTDVRQVQRVRGGLLYSTKGL
jgi:hypothetical protein